jgi:exosortase C (VPDSG-CTERM-specific)
VIPTSTPPSVGTVTPHVEPLRPALSRFVIAGLAVSALFAVPLYQLLRFSLQSDLYSHIGLMPFVAAYLIHLRRAGLPRQSAPDVALASFALVAGAGLGAGYVALTIGGGSYAPVDAFALSTSAYLLCLLGIAAWIFGRALLRAVAFPIALLVFMIPFPVAVEQGIETVLQHGSAEVAYWMISAVGTPIHRNELVFQIPGIVLQVAPECSGIHSTLALLITSLVAGSLFLRSPVHRAILACAVLPLALLRNGFRIFTIAELCVHISPDMIHSYIHRQGGPIFFALSLVPFGLLLYYLRRREGRAVSRPL